MEAVRPYLLGSRMDEEPVCDPTSPEGRRDRAIRLCVEIDTMPWTEEAAWRLHKAHLILLADAKKRPGVEEREDPVARDAGSMLDVRGAISGQDVILSA